MAGRIRATRRLRHVPTLAIAMVALTVLAAACADGDDTSPSTTIAGGGDAVTTAAPSSTTRAAATTSTAASTTPTLPATTAVFVVRPARFDTWIAVLESLPTAEYNEESARSVAAAAHPDAQLLLSDDYATLNPGFWVVYLGEHEFQWEAAQACHDSAPDCYTRYLAGIIPSSPVGADSATALAVTATGELVVLSTTTGERLWAPNELAGGDGAFPGPMTLAGDGMSVFHSVGFEDYWFSCDASDGTLMQAVFENGSAEQIGDGFSPDVSPDGGSLLYLASSQCFPDPAEPQFVLAPIDTIVRRDLATGGEQRIAVPLTGDPEAGYELWSVVWGPDGDVYVLDTSGTVWWHPPGPAGGGWLGEGGVSTELGGQGDVELVGFDDAAQLLLYTVDEWTDDAVTTHLHGIDIPSGEPPLIDGFSGGATIALDATGDALLVISDGVLESGIDVEDPVWQLTW